MECNKDEAKRAMDIAERKVLEKDYNGAKRFANKAQNLYPPLDGLKQMLMMIDVYISGEKKINGEADWCGVLGVEPMADDEAVRRQYRKLVLMLHPDKNKCKGAEGAFNLLQEAWSRISDKAIRSSYNNNRQGEESQQRSEVPPRPPRTNGFQNAREDTVASGRARPEPVVPSARARSEHVVPNARARTKPAARMDRFGMTPPGPKGSGTFWTMCVKCTTQYEYQRVYLNQTLLCPNCRESFVAAERPPPASVLKPVNLSSNQHHRSSKSQATKQRSSGTSFGRKPAPSIINGFRWDSVPGMAGSDSRKEAVDVVQQAQDTLKRGFWESQERDAARGFTNSDLKNFKKPRTDASHMSGAFAGKWSNQMGSGMGSTEMPSTIGSRHPHIQGILLPCDISKALQNKAQSDISKRLLKISAETDENVITNEREKKNTKATSKMSSKANGAEMKSGQVEEVQNDTDPEESEVNAIVVPDSDFHNFDLDRSENSFGDDQIWAAYDNDDGMPRFYARIQKVISLNPFKMKISWLNTKSCSEFGPIDWVGSGFAKTCGDFRSGRYETTDALNAFSHKVEFTKGARGILHILPRKGQVWALYRHWSPEWNQNTPDEVKHTYDMVEVRDEYTEDKPSLTVTLLVKVEGFRAVFRRSAEEKDMRKVPKEEMFRFSHQVPHYILTGKEADNAPEGCLELDPAATPCEVEAKEATKMDIDKSSTAQEEVGMIVD